MCTGYVLGQFYNGVLSEWSTAQRATGSNDPHFNVITLSMGGDDVGFKSISLGCYKHQIGWALLQSASWETAARNPVDPNCPITSTTLNDHIARVVAGNTPDPKHLNYGRTTRT